MISEFTSVRKYDVLDPNFILAWCEMIQEFYDLTKREKFLISKIEYYAEQLVEAMGVNDEEEI